MTLIMVWRERDLERVWLVSDSRLSQRGGAGHVRLTDNGAKLLGVELILRRQIPLSVLGIPVASAKLAFVYAGSALVALQSYAAVLPLWSHLQTSGDEVLPSIADCAAHLGRFVAAYAHEVSGAHGQFQPCECAIVGFDNALGAIDGWSVAAVPGDRLHAALRRLDLSPGAIEMFGSGTAAARERLRHVAAPSKGVWQREPLEMIRAELHCGSAGAMGRGDVGGGVQLGFVSQGGFEIMFDVVPGHPFAEMRFRGFDYSEIQRIGDAFVNILGLA